MTNSLQEIEKIGCEVLQKRDDVLNALLFGSWASGDAHPLSDVDIAIQCRREPSILEHAEMAEELRELLGRRVDLVLMERALVESPLLAYRIYRNHRLLFCRDREGYDAFRTAALHAYMDLLPLLHEQQEAFEGRLRDGTFATIQTA